MPTLKCHLCSSDFGDEYEDLERGDSCPNCGRAFLHLSPYEDDPDKDEEDKNESGDWFTNTDSD